MRKSSHTNVWLSSKFTSKHLAENIDGAITSSVRLHRGKNDVQPASRAPVRQHDTLLPHVLGKTARRKSGRPEGAVVLPITVATPTSVRDRLDQLFQQRIVIFDGSMGVMLQHKGLSDEQFRGERFRNHPQPLRNNSDVLCLTQPEIVSQVHREYLDAGADIITTNTFTATRVSQAD